ncbi:hypothetical protein [Porphyromonas loveana]|uniref:hypothetical protein n=1 Tax=Porphyromonas loveana TaxID=1884669 RepID=UPI0035A151EA
MKNYPMKRYDLTNKEGYKIATQDLLLVTNPILYLGKKLIEQVFSPSIEKQKQAAEDLIKQGKSNGVKEMEIIMEDRKGFHLDVPIEDVNIKMGAGMDGKVTVKVTYK